MSQKSEVTIPESEYTISAIRASGPGGQHVNKVSTAIELRFDVAASTLPEEVKTRLLQLTDRRITVEGVIIIKASASRSQKQNRAAAVERLHDIVHKATRKIKRRVPTKPTKSAIEKRLGEKARRSAIKVQRRKPD